MTNQKWFSWQDLIDRWNIKEFEFLNYFKEGLQLYHPGSGLAIYCPNLYHALSIKKRRLSRLEENLIGTEKLDVIEKIFEDFEKNGRIN